METIASINSPRPRGIERLRDDFLVVHGEKKTRLQPSVFRLANVSATVVDKTTPQSPRTTTRTRRPLPGKRRGTSDPLRFSCRKIRFFFRAAKAEKPIIGRAVKSPFPASLGTRGFPAKRSTRRYNKPICLYDAPRAPANGTAEGKRIALAAGPYRSQRHYINSVSYDPKTCIIYTRAHYVVRRSRANAVCAA